MMTTYNVAKYTGYHAMFMADEWYAVYEDVEGQRTSRAVALFVDKGEAELYAEIQNKDEK